jgi:hypothetical protein
MNKQTDDKGHKKYAVEKVVTKKVEVQRNGNESCFSSHVTYINIYE